MATIEVPHARLGSRLRRRRKVLVLSLAATTIVLLLTGVAWHWYNTASDLTSYNGINESVQFRVGQSFYVGSDLQPTSPSSGHRTLDVSRVRPHLTVNTAGATVDVLLCKVADPNAGLGTSLDTALCATVTQFHAGRVDLGFPATEIIYRVTATRPGIVRIEGARVSYYDGTRHGDQLSGSGIVLKVSA